jgi:hypothetical protein
MHVRERRDSFVHVHVVCFDAYAKHLNDRADAESECACSDMDCSRLPAGQEIICACIHIALYIYVIFFWHAYDQILDLVHKKILIN